MTTIPEPITAGQQFTTGDVVVTVERVDADTVTYRTDRDDGTTRWTATPADLIATLPALGYVPVDPDDRNPLSVPELRRYVETPIEGGRVITYQQRGPGERHWQAIRLFKPDEVASLAVPDPIGPRRHRLTA